MKNVKLILSCLIVLITLSVTAQNNNFNRNSSANFNGMNNNNNTNTEFQNERRKAEVEKEKEKSIQRSITRLKADLELDELQVIAIQQILTENVRIEGIILKKEESDEDKLKALTALSETTDTKIKALLNKKQIEKFIALKDDLDKKKRKK